MPLPAPAAALGLFLVGLGNSPLFPKFNYLTPQNFGEDDSQSVMGTQMAGQYGSLVLGVLLIVPLVSDEVLCMGAAILKISLPRFLNIGIIAKIISVGMVAFSGSLGALCGLKHWQIIDGEIPSYILINGIVIGGTILAVILVYWRLSASFQKRLTAYFVQEQDSYGGRGADPSAPVTVVTQDRGRLHICISNRVTDASSLEPDQMFERFYRGDKARSDAKSSGLGLAIVKRILELHGGEVRASLEGEELSVHLFLFKSLSSACQ